MIISDPEFIFGLQEYFKEICKNGSCYLMVRHNQRSRHDLATPEGQSRGKDSWRTTYATSHVQHWCKAYAQNAATSLVPHPSPADCIGHPAQSGTSFNVHSILHPVHCCKSWMHASHARLGKLDYRISWNLSLYLILWGICHDLVLQNISKLRSCYHQAQASLSDHLSKTHVRLSWHTMQSLRSCLRLVIWHYAGCSHRYACTSALAYRSLSGAMMASRFLGWYVSSSRRILTSSAQLIKNVGHLYRDEFRIPGRLGQWRLDDAHGSNRVSLNSSSRSEGQSSTVLVCLMYS